MRRRRSCGVLAGGCGSGPCAVLAVLDTCTKGGAEKGRGKDPFSVK